jgi:hypothetical protein
LTLTKILCMVKLYFWKSTHIIRYPSNFWMMHGETIFLKIYPYYHTIRNPSIFWMNTCPKNRNKKLLLDKINVKSIRNVISVLNIILKITIKRTIKNIYAKIGKHLKIYFHIWRRVQICISNFENQHFKNDLIKSTTKFDARKKNRVNG